MHRSGHVGLALLAWAPFGWILATVGGAPGLAVAGGLTAVALSTLPDVDTLGSSSIWIDHRGPTHSFVFVAATAAVAASLGFWIGSVPGVAEVLGAADASDAPSQFVVAATLGAAGGLSVCSHLAGDVLTPMGVAPWWPLSRRRYTLDVAPARSPALNYAALALGLAATVVAIAGTLSG